MQVMQRLNAGELDTLKGGLPPKQQDDIQALLEIDGHQQKAAVGNVEPQPYDEELRSVQDTLETEAVYASEKQVEKPTNA